MAFNGFKVADSDMHIFEPPDLWQRYIDPAYRHAAPVGLTEMRRDMRVQGEVARHAAPRAGAADRAGAAAPWTRGAGRASTPHAEARGWDPDLAARGDGRRGPRPRGAVPDPRPLRARPRHAADDRASTASSRALRRRDRARLQRLAARLLQGAPGALLRRRHGGAARRRPRRSPRRGAASSSSASRRSSSRPAASTAGPWHDPDYDPLWAECERLERPDHASTAAGRTYLKPDFSLEVLDKLMMWHTFNQPLGIMTVPVSLTAGGVFERFPKLRVGAARGQLLVGAVAALPTRRALRVGRPLRGAGAAR